MRTIQLALKAEYFDAIRAGTKTQEYRLANDYWRKRLYHPPTPVGNLARREFDQIILTRGYPKRGDAERTMIFPWRGFSEITITHPHFGPYPVKVFAITVLP